MFDFLFKIFIRLLTGIVNAPSHAKCISLKNQKYKTQPTLINLHPNKYAQGLPCYPSGVNLERYIGICNTLNDLSKKVCVPNKTKKLNLSVFNIITGINASKTLTKHILCE